jgi:hypothetical protein
MQTMKIRDQGSGIRDQGIRGQGSEVKDQKTADLAWVPPILDNRILDY